MRAVALSVWLFMNLVFLGMCGYMYLLWRQYWLHSERQQTNHVAIPTPPAYPYDIQYLDLVVQHGQEDSAEETRSKHTNRSSVQRAKKMPRLRSKTNVLDSKCRPEIEDCEGSAHSNVKKVLSSVIAHKTQLVVEMRRVLLDEGSIFAKDKNVYGVKYTGTKGTMKKTPPREIVCSLKKSANLRMLKRKDEPFQTLGMDDLFPAKPIFSKQREQKQPFRSCAVIASAASLLDSQLGNFIDSHDAVVRFNHAPTDGYESDVGSKTTIRIVNSQVISKPEFNFLNNPIYDNITMVAWDPCNYTSSLIQWYERPDFDLFTNYWNRRQKRPNDDFYMLDPRSAWPVWNFIQGNTPARLRRNPPSSGFLGLVLMLPLCNHVDMIEYMPSVRETKRCHYYDTFEDRGCTFGAWHPLAAEKLLALSMSSSDDNEIFGRGILRIQGYPSLNC
ncbi:beta-galactoside alpha-2,6-sialyltransferase 2 isoform X2 [Neocloeon triangulifer]|nr:beta-galactoside alpha-2,6-sialyltransferase 2 isoform X2 [Neocloeon triangulifer]